MLTELEAEIDINGVVHLLHPIKVSRKTRAVVRISDSDAILRNGTENGSETTSIRDLFGSVSLGHPTGTDNVVIDVDLAREYSSKHGD